MRSGDCAISLEVLAGPQRAGRDVDTVWFDAHAKLTTTSGYLGGFPLGWPPALVC